MENNIKGITLIALVITIIVLLILAGISIATLMGDNGILTRVNQAALETEIANIAERINLINTNQNMDFILGNTQEDTLSYLVREGMVDDKNVINTKKVLNEDTKYGKGTKNDIYKIEGKQIIYINEKGERAAKINVEIRTNDFVTEWTVQENDIIVLPIAYQYKGDNDFILNWGDGSPVEYINDQETPLGVRPQHQYKKAGTYQIIISGKCSYFTCSSIDNEFPNVIPKLTRLVSWGEIKSRRYNFEKAINMEGSIPSPNKNTFLNYNSDGFKNLFYRCEKIADIPEDLFANIPDTIDSFRKIFYQCKSIKKIPNKLFEKAVNVQTYEEAFYYCTGLTEIPEGLFSNSPQATNFANTFYRCENIKSIPDNIFANNLNITNLRYTFYNLELVTSAPKLWERTTAQLDGTGCFGSCDNLNTNDIEQSIIDIWFAIEP